MHTEPASERPTERASERACELPRRLLWADDCRVLRRAVGRALSRYAELVTPLLVENGDAAVEQAPLFRPHVVALDVDMPGQSGFDVCRRLKAHELTRYSRIVMVTGSAAPDLEEEARAAGADAVLQKPVPVREVLSVLGVLAHATHKEGR